MLFTSDISTLCSISRTKKSQAFLYVTWIPCLCPRLFVCSNSIIAHILTHRSLLPYCFFSYEPTQVYLTATPSQTHTNTSAGIVKIQQRLFLYCSDENWSNESEVIPANCTWFLFEAMCAWALGCVGVKKKKEREHVLLPASFSEQHCRSWYWTFFDFLLWLCGLFTLEIFIGKAFLQTGHTARTGPSW